MKHIERLSPARMSPPERAAEITAILAAAIIRTQTAEPAAESEATPQRVVQLGFCPPKSVHATPYPKESL